MHHRVELVHCYKSWRLKNASGVGPPRVFVQVRSPGRAGMVEGKEAMMAETISIGEEGRPFLPLMEGHVTCATLHLWTQIVGKARLALSPLLSHWWEVPLYFSAAG